jgi:hypothetical protein
VGGIGLCGRQIGADHIDAVECGLGGDAEVVLGEAERVVGDADLEMLGHVAPSQHRADGLADRRGAAQWTARPLHAGLDARQLLLGAGQQLRAFTGALFGQQRVFADHQAFARIIGAGDLCHVAVPGLRRAGLNSEGCNGPPSAASCLIAGARSAVIQSRPAGRNVCSIRALVSSPRSPTITMRCR